MNWKFNVGDLVVSKAGLQIMFDANEACVKKKDYRFVQFVKWSRIIGREMDECAGGCCQRWYTLERENGDRAKLHEDSLFHRDEVKEQAKLSFMAVFDACKKDS